MEVEKQRALNFLQESIEIGRQHHIFMSEPQHSSSGDDDTTPSCVGVGDTSLSNESKSKKRRKQSNPVKYQSTLPQPNTPPTTITENECGEEGFASPGSSSEHDLKFSPDESQNATLYICPHCNGNFQSDIQLTMHIEEEHVQKAVAKQIQQRNVTSSNKIESDSLPKTKWPNTPSNLEPSTSLSLPHVPPLVPLSASSSPSLNTPTSKQMGIPLPPIFPGSLSPFIFPHLMSQRQTPPIVNGSPIPNSGIRIFNPEAFCEICSKEFCNKYFLKTHKANMHGIYSNDTPATSPSYTGSYISNTSLTTSVPMPPYLQNSNSTPSLDNSLPQSSIILNKEAYCEICQKEFCNKYFLRKHRQKIHGLIDTSQQPLTPSMMSSIPNDCKGSNVSISYSQQNFTDKLSSQEDIGTNRKSDSHSISAMFNFSNSKTPISGTPPSFTMSDTKSSLPSPQDTSSSNGNGITFFSDKYRQNHLEGYCEICCKSFGNKHFLRTHLINVHGINIPEINSKEVANSFSQSQPLQLTMSSKMKDLGDDESKLEDEKPPSEQNMKIKNSTDVTCDICTRPFESSYFLKMHKHYFHNIPYLKEDEQSKSPEETHFTTSPIEGNEKQESNITPDDAASPDLQKLQTMIKELNAVASISENSTNSTVCRLCHQECENKYYLRAHMMNEHGVLPNEDGNPVLNVSSSVPTSIVYSSSQNSFSSTEEAELRQKLQLSNKFFNHATRLLSSSNSEDIPKSQEAPLSLVTSSSSLPLVTTTLAPPFPSLLTHNGNGLSQAMFSGANPLSNPNFDPKSRPVIGRNYCYICNKELCNKYFMKTHMLKMHGINLENQALEASQISTIGGVTCDICQKELCSKYFLKVHKQNTHGIYEEPLPPKENSTLNHNNNLNNNDKDLGLLAGEVSETSNRYFTHYTEVCPLCERRFKSIKWLKTHMVNDHNEIIKENLCGHMESPPPLAQTSLPPSSHHDSALICVLCGQGFAEKVTLQIHLIKDHRTPSEDLETNSGIKTTPSSSALVLHDQMNHENEDMSSNPSSPHSGVPLNGRSRIYQCSYCIYSTKWLSNLYVHEKRHTGMIIEGDKKFACRICHRAYRYNHSLQRHLYSHKIAGLTLKETNFSSVILPQDLSLRGEEEDQGQNNRFKRYRCSKCNKKFRTREMCMNHIHTHHRGRKNMMMGQHKFLKCHLCGFTTKIWGVLRLHIRKFHHEDTENAYNRNSQRSTPKLETKESLSLEMARSDLPLVNAQTPPQLPMAYAMPQTPPNEGSFIMQPFLIAQPESDDSEQIDTFVPSLVYLPVCQKVSQPVTVAFTLTPA